MSAERLVRFGNFELDHASGELWRNGKRVPLQTQPAQVLCQLVSHPGDVVSRDELRRLLWTDGTFGEFDTGINVAVNKIRRALQDSATTPRFVETLPGRGYRFLADVRPVRPLGASPATAFPVSAPASEPAAPARPSRRWVLAGALFAAAAIVVLVAWQRAARSPAPTPIGSPRSVAVLPFKPLLAEGGDRALEMGMTEAVIVKLGQLSQLRVPSINAVRRFGALDADALTAGRELGVEAVLEGTLQRQEGNLRVSARLLDVKRGTASWAQQWDVPWTGVLDLQDTIATEVARTLALRLGAAEEASLREHPTNAAAYEPYLRARYLLGRRSAEDSRRAIELLEEAGRLDPSSAAVQAALAFADISVPLGENSVGPLVESGRLAATRALELDPRFAEAHAVLGRIAFQYGWNPKEGERRFRRALELDPDNAFALHCFSHVLAQQGRIDEALALNDRALRRDPTSVGAIRDRGFIFHAARRFDDAVAQYQKSLELDRSASQTYNWLGRTYATQGRDADSVQAFLGWLTFSDVPPDTVAAIRGAAEKGGLPAFWERWLELEGARSSEYNVARAHLFAGDRDAALSWLEKAYATGSPGIRYLTMPEWDGLRGDARFQDLVRRAGLPAVTTVAGAR